MSFRNYKRRDCTKAGTEFSDNIKYCKYFKSDKRPDDSKIISKAQFAKEVKKLIGRTKKSKIAMGSLKKNTTVNRAKYL